MSKVTVRVFEDGDIGGPEDWEWMVSLDDDDGVSLDALHSCPTREAALSQARSALAAFRALRDEDIVWPEDEPHA